MRSALGAESVILRPDSRMPQLLQHPAIQAGAVPLLAALIVMLALGRTRFGGLAVAAAFATAVALASGA